MVIKYASNIERRIEELTEKYGLIVGHWHVYVLTGFDFYGAKEGGLWFPFSVLIQENKPEVELRVNYTSDEIKRLGYTDIYGELAKILEETKKPVAIINAESRFS